MSAEIFILDYRILNARQFAFENLYQEEIGDGYFIFNDDVIF